VVQFAIDVSCIFPELLSVVLFDMKNEKASDKKCYRDLVWGIGRPGVQIGRMIAHSVSCVCVVFGRAWYLPRTAGTKDDCAAAGFTVHDRLDRNLWPWRGDVKHDAGPLGVFESMALPTRFGWPEMIAGMRGRL
jgi:hypothetical protein